MTLVFDADAAGQKGTKRAIDLLRDTGVDIRVITIPDGKDPDEFIRLHGPERFKLLMERAANDVEYRLIELGRRYSLDTADGRVLYLKEAAGLLAGLSSPIERDVYAGKLAQELSVSKEALLSQVESRRRQQAKKQQERQLSQIVRAVGRCAAAHQSGGAEASPGGECGGGPAGHANPASGLY